MTPIILKDATEMHIFLNTISCVLKFRLLPNLNAIFLCQKPFCLESITMEVQC